MSGETVGIQATIRLTPGDVDDVERVTVYADRPPIWLLGNPLEDTTLAMTARFDAEPSELEEIATRLEEQVDVMVAGMRDCAARIRAERAQEASAYADAAFARRRAAAARAMPDLDGGDAA